MGSMFGGKFGASPTFSSPQPSLPAAGLHYFIVRPNKTMVPIVPVDQLPFQLKGVPRKLEPSQLASMHFLCEMPDAPQLQLESISQTGPANRFFAPDAKDRGAVVTMLSKRLPKSAPVFIDPKPNVQNTLEADNRKLRSASPTMPAQPSLASPPTVSLTDEIASEYRNDTQRFGYSPRTLPPSGIAPDLSKKEYCTYWIKTGECAFMSQGCRYKHEMPSVDKLRMIGFNAVPKWWKEKSAINPRLTWIQRRMNQGKELESQQATESLTRGGFRSLARREEKEHPATSESSEPKATESLGDLLTDLNTPKMTTRSASPMIMARLSGSDDTTKPRQVLLDMDKAWQRTGWIRRNSHSSSSASDGEVLEPTRSREAQNSLSSSRLSAEAPSHGPVDGAYKMPCHRQSCATSVEDCNSDYDEDIPAHAPHNSKIEMYNQFYQPSQPTIADHLLGNPEENHTIRPSGSNIPAGNFRVSKDHSSHLAAMKEHGLMSPKYGGNDEGVSLQNEIVTRTRARRQPRKKGNRSLTICMPANSTTPEASLKETTLTSDPKVVNVRSKKPSKTETTC
ncbi:hypothetical protein K469DRAFT_745186 [Zopfia rhizophila CBS 207.26]|uniref:C3H1-type domain-containing protein n=1 Tax=Zopfia rhizophila CBS 207.26 TaxID=1314779 RepID=A0A6A6EQZ1_9PEZI|nr:hypothetical protein K469DRAFT_745186 [Zopfia rhizophila CBS 207.26]